MTLKKGLKYGISILVILCIIWYVFIKNYDYQITFKSSQSPGSVYTNILGWNNFENADVKAVTTLNKKPFSEIFQQLKVNDTLIDIHWEFKIINDSTTKVIGRFKDVEHSLKQKLLVPFIKTDFVKRNLYTMETVRHSLNEFNKTYKVGSIETSNLSSKFCVYIPVECKMPEKANNMIRNVSYIMNFIRDNNLKLVGDPFLEITKWDPLNNNIAFDFCFPIENITEYPESPELKFKTTKALLSLKTIFNGNYRISDRAWFKLLDYSNQKNIAVDSLPIEIYKNDPHGGGDELKWEAEIYMPLKQ